MNTTILNFFSGCFKPTRALLLGALTLACITLPAPAPIYMKMGDIKGEVTTEGYKDWIEVSSVQWGLARSISTPTGASADRESSAPTFSEVATMKLTDKATVHLFRESLTGEGQDVELHFVKLGSNKPETYQKMLLKDVMISGFSQSSGGDLPSESLSLNFTKITLTTVVPQQPNPQEISVTYDLARARVE